MTRSSNSHAEKLPQHDTKSPAADPGKKDKQQLCNYSSVCPVRLAGLVRLARLKRWHWSDYDYCCSETVCILVHERCNM